VRRRPIPKTGSKYEKAYGESNGHVTDDSCDHERSKICLEPNILKTAGDATCGQSLVRLLDSLL